MPRTPSEIRVTLPFFFLTIPIKPGVHGLPVVHLGKLAPPRAKIHRQHFLED